MNAKPRRATTPAGPAGTWECAQSGHLHPRWYHNNWGICMLTSTDRPTYRPFDRTASAKLDLALAQAEAQPRRLAPRVALKWIARRFVFAPTSREVRP